MGNSSIIYWQLNRKVLITSCYLMGFLSQMRTAHLICQRHVAEPLFNNSKTTTQINLLATKTPPHSAGLFKLKPWRIERCKSTSCKNTKMNLKVALMRTIYTTKEVSIQKLSQPTITTPNRIINNRWSTWSRHQRRVNAVSRTFAEVTMIQQWVVVKQPAWSITHSVWTQINIWLKV